MNIDFQMMIIKLRAKLNWKQSDLAEAMGVSVATVNRWENKRNEPLAVQKVKLLELFEKNGIGA